MVWKGLQGWCVGYRGKQGSLRMNRALPVEIRSQIIKQVSQ